MTTSDSNQSHRGTVVLQWHGAERDDQDSVEVARMFAKAKVGVAVRDTPLRQLAVFLGLTDSKIVR